MMLLVAEPGEDAALEAFADRALPLLHDAFPGWAYQLVFWGEADANGLLLLAEEAARTVIPGMQVPYEICRLRLGPGR